MFADPQTVTINAVGKTLARTDSGGLSGTFASAADGLSMRVAHTKGARNRGSVTLKTSKISSDPFVPANNRNFEMSQTFSFVVPEVGFTVTEVKQQLQGLIDWLDVAANLDKLVNGES